MQNINIVGQPTPVPNDCDGQIIHPETCSPPNSGSGFIFSGLHNSLDGIQGGTVNERYHLTKREHDSLAQALTNVMDLTTNQTADGIKTFTQSPQVPDGVTGLDVVNFEQLAAVQSSIQAPWYRGPWTTGIGLSTNQVVSKNDQLYLAGSTGTGPNPLNTFGGVDPYYKLLTDSLIGYNYQQPRTNNSTFQIMSLARTQLGATAVKFTIRNDTNSSTAYKAHYEFTLLNDVHVTMLNTWHELKPVKQTAATFDHVGGTFSIAVEVSYNGTVYLFRTRLKIIVSSGSITTIPMFLDARKGMYDAFFNSYPNVSQGTGTDNSTISVIPGSLTNIGDMLYDSAGVPFLKGTDTVYTFSNGVHILSGTNIGLGGTLTADTTTAQAGFVLTYDRGGSATNYINFKTSGTTEAAIVPGGYFFGAGLVAVTGAQDAEVLTNTAGTTITRSQNDAKVALTVAQLGNTSTGHVVEFQNYARSVIAISNDGTVTHTPLAKSVSTIATAYNMLGGLLPTANGDTLIGMKLNPMFGNSTISAWGTLVGGTGYPNGTKNATVTGGTGVLAIGQAVVSGGVVTSFTLVSGGINYTVGNVLTIIITDANGNPVGTGGTVTVSAITSYTGLTKIALETYGLDVYDQDYTSSYTARTKVDKHYVDTQIATITGGGAVTTIGVTTANGVSGTSSGGTTPNLTISLGAITPTSVAASGALSGTILTTTGSINLANANVLGWNSDYKVLHMNGDSGVVSQTSAHSIGLYNNVYFPTTSTYTYSNTGLASKLILNASGGLVYSTAVSGTGGTAATLSDIFAISTIGSVSINYSGSGPALTINSGNLTLAAATTTNPSAILTSGASYAGTTDGSIWYDGTHLYAYIAGAPRQIDRQTVSSTGISAISIATANGVSGTSSGGATPTLTFTLRTSVREVPSGLLNGTNVTFGLAHTPLTSQELIFLNGILLNSGDDYTISGATITMLATPVSTDKILACYPY